MQSRVICSGRAGQMATISPRADGPAPPTPIEPRSSILGRQSAPDASSTESLRPCHGHCWCPIPVVVLPTLNKHTRAEKLRECPWNSRVSPNARPNSFASLSGNDLEMVVCRCFGRTHDLLIVHGGWAEIVEVVRRKTCFSAYAREHHTRRKVDSWQLGQVQALKVWMRYSAI